jgi:hypothetical protein
MESTHKRGGLFVHGLSGFFKTLTSDSYIFLKIVAPILLLVSFITVLNGWLELRGSQNLSEPMRDILNVPLMLFGVVAIINVMVFKEASSSTFLAVFFIGTVIVGPEMAEKALRATTGGAAVVYDEGSGGLGQVSYSSGGGVLPGEVKAGESSKTEP